ESQTHESPAGDRWSPSGPSRGEGVRAEMPSAGQDAEPEVGIEPTTYRLQGGCSTTERHRPVPPHPSREIPGHTYPGRPAAVDRHHRGRVPPMTPGERFTR